MASQVVATSGEEDIEENESKEGIDSDSFEHKQESNNLTDFLESNGLEDMCQIFISHKLTLDNFKNMDFVDLRELCDSFGFTTPQKIRLKQAVKKLQQQQDNNSDTEEKEEEKRPSKLSKQDKMHLGKLLHFEYKALMLGDSRVGKSSVMIRMIKNEFDQYKFPTIGATFLSYGLPVGDDDNVKTTVGIWDTAGQEKYRDLAPLYYRGAYGCIIVNDITNRESFENARKWVDEVYEHEGRHVKIILIGNKIV